MAHHHSDPVPDPIFCGDLRDGGTVLPAEGLAAIPLHPVCHLCGLPGVLVVSKCLLTLTNIVHEGCGSSHGNYSINTTYFCWYFRLIPESPRWLLVVGRQKAAVRILEDAARKNGLDVTAVKKVVTNRGPQQARVSSTEHKATLADLLKTPNLRRNITNRNNTFLITFSNRLNQP